MELTYRCQACGLRSFHPGDIEERFCCHCRRFEGERLEVPPRLFALVGTVVREVRDATEVTGTAGGRKILGQAMLALPDGHPVSVLTQFRPVAVEGADEGVPLLFDSVVVCERTGREFDHLARSYRDFAEAERGHLALVEELTVTSGARLRHPLT